MVDKSWGVGATGNFRVRTNDSSEERAAKRAENRQARASERANAMAQRLEARATGSEADIVARERARIERREREQQSASGDPHAAATKRHRSSGRKEFVKEQRDTLSYTTVVNAGRIRELAKRAATTSGLAGAFGISEAEVGRLINALSPNDDASA